MHLWYHVLGLSRLNAGLNLIPKWTQILIVFYYLHIAFGNILTIYIYLTLLVCGFITNKVWIQFSRIIPEVWIKVIGIDQVIWVKFITDL